MLFLRAANSEGGVFFFFFRFQQLSFLITGFNKDSLFYLAKPLSFTTPFNNLLYMNSPLRVLQLLRN